LLLTIGALLIAGCGSSSKKSSSTSTTDATTASIPEVVVTATEYSFKFPQPTLPSGLVKITLKNEGTAPEGHQMNLIKMGSLTLNQIKARVAKTDLKGLPADVKFVGGPNGVDPGKSASAIVDLEPGDYAAVCFIPDAKGKPHAALGMISQITVSAGANPVTTIDSKGTITLSDFTFVFPKPMTGDGTFEVKNVGVQVHELALFQILPGKTLEDVKKYVFAQSAATGPPPFASVPGMTGLSTQEHAYLPMDLAPGKYAAFCFYPDTRPGRNDLPHAVGDNMVQEFTIG
jgi:hypothetical protein